MTSESTLNAALRETEDEIVGRQGEAIKILFDQQIEAAARQLTARPSLGVGATAPDFHLPSTLGLPLSLYGALESRQIILTFYRGSWCNFCNTALGIWQRSLPAVHGKDAALWGIAPETPERALEFHRHARLDYPLLSDQDNVVADAYGLVFEMPRAARETLLDLGTDVASHNGADDWSVPITATYVIGRDRRILFADCGPDYRERAEPQAVIAAL